MTAAYRVVLLFDRAERVAAARPAQQHEGLPGSLFDVETLRGLWRYSVRAADFVAHHQVGRGEYPARLLLDLRLVTFEVGPPCAQPAAGVPSGGSLLDEDGPPPEFLGGVR